METNNDSPNPIREDDWDEAAEENYPQELTEVLQAADVAEQLEQAQEEVARLARQIPAILQAAIQGKETSPEEYLASGGRNYRGSSFCQVYGHGGEPCPACGAPLCRTVIGGRSSVYCPCCQPPLTKGR